jgi:hypothetical protein
MKKIYAAMFIALAAGTVQANPAVDSWPWDDTTVGNGLTGDRWCETGATTRVHAWGAPLILQFRCQYFSDYKTNPGAMQPHCSPATQNYSALCRIAEIAILHARAATSLMDHAAAWKLAPCKTSPAEYGSLTTAQAIEPRLTASSAARAANMV